MTKTYITTMNKKNYFCIGLTMVGLMLTILNQVLIPVGLLVLIVTLFDGPLNKDIFVVRDKKLYLLNANEKMIFRTIALLIIGLGFVLCLSKIYMASLILFYGLIIILFIFNIVVSKQNNDFIKKQEELTDDPIEGYKTFEILEVIDNKSSLTFKMRDKFTRDSYELEYKVSSGFTDYKELCNLLKTFKYDDSPVVEQVI
ncbi:MAG: hypothetical protein Q4E69_03015 [Bacilli bacterium]|nr:hypothetical protein [Bacilli bacterium]